MPAAIAVVPTHGDINTTVTVNGTGWTNTETLSLTTVGGVSPINTIDAQVVGVSGNWTGTFVVPDLSTGAKTVSVTGSTSGAKTTSFTVDPSIWVDPSGGVGAVANASVTTIAATVTTTANPDTLVAVVAWKDYNSNLTISSVTDNSGTTGAWSPRGPIKSYAFSDGSGNQTFYKIQEWSASAPLTLAGKVVTAHFSGTTTGHSAIVVFGVSDSGSFDSNAGLPSGQTFNFTGTAFSSSIVSQGSPALVIASILAVPNNALTADTAAGFVEVVQEDATDFRLEVQVNAYASAQDGLAVSWSATSAGYTGVIMLDALVQSGGGDFPFETDYKVEIVKDAFGNILWSHAVTPTISTSGNVTTFDSSGGAGTTETAKHVSKKSIESNSDNQFTS